MKKNARTEAQKNRRFNTKIMEKPFCCFACFMAVYVEDESTMDHAVALTDPQITIVHDMITPTLN